MKKDLAKYKQKNINELRSDVDKKKIALSKEFAVTSSSKKREFKKSRELKLEIARILTIIREKELTGEVVDESKPKTKIVKKSVKKPESKRK